MISCCYAIKTRINKPYFSVLIQLWNHRQSHNSKKMYHLWLVVFLPCNTANRVQSKVTGFLQHSFICISCKIYDLHNKYLFHLPNNKECNKCGCKSRKNKRPTRQAVKSTGLSSLWNCAGQITYRMVCPLLRRWIWFVCDCCRLINCLALRHDS